MINLLFQQSFYKLAKGQIMSKKALSFQFLFSYLLSSSFIVLALTGCACTDQRKPEANNKDKQSSDKEVAQLETTQLKRLKAPVQEAFVKITPYGDNKISGIVTFTKVPDGIKIVADVNGLKPGKHGFHAHEHGDCSGTDGMKAGGHFNPTNSKHGGPDSAERHVGDFGNLEADQNGYARYERVDKIISFEGEKNIIGKSIIIHADPDDYVTQPTGASGARIACGLIEARSNESGANSNK